MTSYTRKLHEISPREAVKLHRQEMRDYRYGKHVTLAQFTPSFRSETNESAPSYGHRAGLAAPSFGKRVSPPLLPAYECWAPELGKPKQIVRAADSFAARREYAAYHQIVVSDVAARRK